MSTTEQAVPDAVTFREVQEILRTFRDSDWTGMTVHLHGMRITVGKHGPPAGGRGPHAAPGATTEQSPATPARSAGTSPARETNTGGVPPVEKPAGAPLTGAAAAPPAAVVDTSGCVSVTSPAVGAFWTAPSPGQPPFVQVGDVVEVDQQLAIVEVMKLMNPVVTTVAGTVEAVCAANAELVEYEQTLFWIRPADG